MARLKMVGFFRELVDGDITMPSLKSCISESPNEDEERIVNYLKSGVMLAAAPTGPIFDYFDRSKNIDFGQAILTDGVWSWLRELAYYVEEYHVRLPEDFTLHMQAKNWQAPDDINTSDLEVT